MDVLGADTVTFIRRDVAGQDRYGSDVTVDTETTITGCSMQPMWGQENLGNLDQVTDRWQLWISPLALLDQGINPEGIDPEAIDAIRFRGLLYEINGKPQFWTTLDGALDNVVLLCRRVEG